MPFDPEKHHRRSIRLKGYDYTQAGTYFVTICTQNRECLFGEIVNRSVQLNRLGKIVQACWYDLPNRYDNVDSDAVIMPNHVHEVIVLVHATMPVGAGSKPAPTQITVKNDGLSEIVRSFKTFSSRRINKIRNTPGTRVWQRNYYETIVHNEHSLNRIRQYIANNLLRWAIDRNNPWGR